MYLTFLDPGYSPFEKNYKKYNILIKRIYIHLRFIKKHITLLFLCLIKYVPGHLMPRLPLRNKKLPRVPLVF